MTYSQLILSLSIACLKIDCRQTRTAIYETIKSLIQSPQDFFEFIYYHRKIFQKKPHGMGSGGCFYLTLSVFYTSLCSRNETSDL